MSKENKFDPTDLNSLSEYCNALTENDVEDLKKLVQLQQTMGDELIARFERNIEAFEKYMPDVAENFKHYRPQKTIEFFCGPNGVPNLLFVDSNEILYKHLDPLYLCQKQVELLLDGEYFSQVKYNNEPDWCGQIHHRYMNEAVNILKNYKENVECPKLGSSVPTCIMLGLGLGYAVGMLYERIEIANLIIIEPNLDLFFASLHCFDWAPLLEFLHEHNYAIYLMLGQNEDQLYYDLATFFDRHGRFLSGFFFNYIHYRNDTINRLAKIIAKDYNRIYNALGFFDDHLFAISHACDTILKKKGLCLRGKDFPDDIANMPVFVVGNGPSLDKDINFIRKNQDKALIVACGTALESLFRAGVQVDFYAATERIPQVAESLKAIPDPHYLDNVVLLTGDVMHPTTTELFKHTCIFAKPDEPFYWIMAKADPAQARKWAIINLMNPLVGNCGIAATAYLGFKQIYMFGLDNGNKVEDRMVLHSSFSTVYEDKDVYDGKKVLEYWGEKNLVPGNFGGKILAYGFFKMAIRHMEVIIKDFVEKDPTRTYINCSDGAFVEGAKPLHSSELEEIFDTKEALDKKKVLDFMDQEKTFTIDITAEKLEEMLAKKEYQEAVDVILKFIKNRPTDRIAYVQMLEGVSEILTALSKSRDRNIAFMLDGTTQSMFILANYCLFHRDDPEQGFKLANEILDLYVMYLEDTKKLYEFLPNYVLGPHQALCHGKIGFDHEGHPAPDMPVIYHVVDPEVIANLKYQPFFKNYGDK